MKVYNLANNIIGWVIFAIAATVYLLTVEPSASFWDCGEFTASAAKLEVGHPPGAPVFMLMGNLFSHLAPIFNVDVAAMVNAMSAIFSALTVMLLFWTITHLTRRLILSSNGKEGTINLTQMITILGAGAVGALAFTFTDTFWYSAVEGEVYAFSSFMTALVFWLILKWEDVADEPHSSRWIILIAYVMGLSIGVHLLNLLCIPAIVLVYYFRRYPNADLKGALIALLISFGMIVAIMYGLIQGIMDVSGWFELLFVNIFKMPYNSGVLAYVIIVFGVLAWAIWESMRANPNMVRVKTAFILAVVLLGLPFLGDSIWLGILIIALLIGFFFIYKRINAAALNLILLCLLVITIGYSSYALIMVRSASNTPMDQGSPEDVFALRDYLAREQYGDTPLFYGYTFAARGVSPNYEEGRPVYTRVIKENPQEKDRYVVTSHKQSISYPDRYNMLFPRMHSRDDRHIDAYSEWANKEYKRQGVTRPIEYARPTFGDNIRFFFSYQINYMYWRYFMWNFSGRQNDIQGHGEISKGNWITGIKFIDNLLVGPQDDMPDFIANNKGHNKYYMLPLLLGLLGILFQVYAGKKGTRQFWITFLLFFMTGLAIVVYLNQSPYQVRERDYAYSGSFYAFCIWIGLGTLAIIQGLNKYLKLNPQVAAIAGVVLALLVPVQMASENWDDHDRSGRYLMRDFGYNYLISCEPDAIIFTFGDNDTFPLWYNQEVEGERTDVRVCNLSYLNGDWYIDQMRMQAYDSPPLPIHWTKEEYLEGTHSVAHVVPGSDKMPPLDVGTVLNRIRSKEVRYKLIYEGDTLDVITTEKIQIPIDSAAIVRSGLVDTLNAYKLNKPMEIDLSADFVGEGGKMGQKSMLMKSELMILEMMKNMGDWSRPFYFASSVGPEQFCRLDPYLRREGIALRIMPYRIESDDYVNTDIMYDNVMNKYRWGNLKQEGLYIDENALKMCNSFRNVFATLASALIEEGDYERAKEVLDKGMVEIPIYNVPYDILSMPTIGQCYAEIGEIEKGLEIYRDMTESSLKTLNWYIRMNDNQFASSISDIYREIAFLQRFYLPFIQVYDEANLDKYLKEFELILMRYTDFMSKQSNKRR